MGQRSPYNDRYKVEQKGKTRRSASSAKPKREIADLTPTDTKPKAKKKTGWFGKSQSGPRPPVQPIVSTPRMKQLRTIWWVLWVIALGVALGILYLQQAVKAGSTAYAPFVGIAWVLWAASMGGAFYLEFVPIRKERRLALEAMAAKPEKGSKQAKGDTKGKGGSEPPAPDDRRPPDSEMPS